MNENTEIEEPDDDVLEDDPSLWPDEELDPDDDDWNEDDATVGVNHDDEGQEAPATTVPED